MGYYGFLGLFANRAKSLGKAARYGRILRRQDPPKGSRNLNPPNRMKIPTTYRYNQTLTAICLALGLWPNPAQAGMTV